MNCNYCGSKMKKCFSINTVETYKTYTSMVYGEDIKNRSRKPIGGMMYCPDCGNLQVDLNLEGK